MKVMVRVAAVSVLALAAAAAVAQPPAAPAPNAPASAPARGPRIAVEPTVFDFGKAQQEKTLEKEFTVRNLDRKSVV